LTSESRNVPSTHRCNSAPSFNRQMTGHVTKSKHTVENLSSSRPNDDTYMVSNCVGDMDKMSNCVGDMDKMSNCVGDMDMMSNGVGGRNTACSNVGDEDIYGVYSSVGEEA
jgi:hypothetical protein